MSYLSLDDVLAIYRSNIWKAAECIAIYQANGDEKRLHLAKDYRATYRQARTAAKAKALRKKADFYAVLAELKSHNALPSIEDMLIKHHIRYRSSATRTAAGVQP
ncbi:MAG TPA: hypothetical protein DCZ12_02060 [Gammaproteobacteria bacterium]|nr:hypothetical protein [Gammaproteobacteria bacterium]